MKKEFYSLVLMLIIVTIFPTQVIGQGKKDFGIKPEDPAIGYFTYILEPGNSASNALVAINYTSKVLQLRISPVDGHTASKGGISFDFEKQDEVKKWVSMPDEGIIELPRNGLKRLPFNITVPLGTQPGEYAFGFLAAVEEQVKPELISTTEGASFNVRVVSRVGISLIIKVPGSTKCGIQINNLDEKVDFGKWKIKVFIQNIGDIPFNGAGTFNIIDKSNQKLLQSIPMKIGYFVRKDQIAYPIITELPPAGLYSIIIQLSDKKQQLCNVNYSKEIQIGEKMVSDYIQQATEVAVSQPTIIETKDVPTLDSTENDQAPINTKLNTPWLTIISIVIFVISLGILIYSQITLRNVKKP